ncbi:hypothetical protein [Enterobacter roggenkampii]|uniref:hypothetical protein n=1 Tax=Enterobacter roggenkampii TaxID=1812935 RepID=UPI002003F318|nr:hypothetical protein [Enterobacter roggenkampii]EKY4018894.1 hypothetical protein [Enterobacter roggenkampii]MCK7367597.1 hypothetical protein [Enterobacter roggenkampii]
MDKCNGLLGAVFGHSFVPVITKSAPKIPLQLEGSASFALKIADAHREQTYHGVYCKRCGKVINS